jgi:hypothetical protein
VSPLELVDDRFGELARELRSSRPVPSPELRERVYTLGQIEAPPPLWEKRPSGRRVVLALAIVALFVSVAAAGVTGLGGRSPKQEVFSNQPAAVPAAPSTRLQSSSSTGESGAAKALDRELTPNPARLQQYDAILRLRVKSVEKLSDATKGAMTLARALGGYVASVDYSTRGGRRGGAALVLRVPITEVQNALGRLTGLGTILGQRTAVLDVTKRADRESKQIAKLERQLETAGPEEAAAIRARLKTLRAKHARLLRSARLARISLAFTTAAPAAAAPPSRFDRTLDDAGAVLVRELQILLYALIVAGPLLLLGGLAVLAARTQRIRSDRRLLERS